MLHETIKIEYANKVLTLQTSFYSDIWAGAGLVTHPFCI